MSESSISQPELLPCPFCGGKPLYSKLSADTYGNKHEIHCRSGCHIGPYVRGYTKDDVFFSWNRRA